MNKIVKSNFKSYCVFLLFCIIVMAGFVGCGKNKEIQYIRYDKLEDGTYYVKEITDAGRDASEITIPSEYSGIQVTCIGRGAFKDCGNLKTVHVPDSVTDIMENAFLNCGSLETIELPDTIASIGANAFEGTAWQRSMLAESGVVIVGSIFVDGSQVSGEYTIPDEIRSIAPEAFKDNNNITRVNLPENIELIGAYSFSSCKNLEAVNLPQTLKRIGYGAFSYCSNLSVAVPKAIQNIEKDAFLEVWNVEYEEEMLSN